MLYAENISRAFPIAGEEAFYALKGVTLRAEKSKLTVLEGKSGSGKTTLINILGGLDAPTTGEVTLSGANLTRMSQAEKCRARREKMGFVFQSVALISLMTAEENVMFALRLAGKLADMRARAMEALAMVGLSQRAQHMPQELSGGEQQRVAIARAIAHRPDILFLDEPTTELDTNTAMQVAKIFRELADMGMTVVLTTHDRELATIGDTVYSLEDGEIIARN